MERTIQIRVPVRDSHVGVEVHGDPDGPAIVVLPGVMSDAAAWAPVARALRRWSTVAVVNRRGRHPSGPLTSDYALDVEVEDAVTVLERFSDVRTLFGWSYGGLIALHAAARQPVPHLVGYEPVMAPFGKAALAGLGRADAAGDRDATVEVALREVTGMTETAIDALRAHGRVWSELCRLGAPIFAETRAINTAPRSAALASLADRVDLVVGEQNQGRAPYGSTFEDVARRTPGAAVHVLPGQGHLAHLEAPTALAAIIDSLE